MEFSYTVPTNVHLTGRPIHNVPHKNPYHMGSRYSTSHSRSHNSPRDTPIRHVPHPEIHLTRSSTLSPLPRGTDRDKHFFSFSSSQFSLEAQSPQLLSKEETFPVSLEFTDRRFQCRPSELDFQSGVIAGFWIFPSDISYLATILSHPQFSYCKVGSFCPTRFKLCFSEFVPTRLCFSEFVLFHLQIITSIRTRVELVQLILLYNIGLGHVPLIIFPHSCWERA